jgi:opacity protein-like surface antigen
MMSRIKWYMAAVLTILMVGGGSAHAVTGISLGVRGGTASLNDERKDLFGSEIDLVESLELDGMTLLGVHVNIGTLPIIDLTVSAEYAWKSCDSKYSIPGEDEGIGEVTYHHFSLNGSVKYKILKTVLPVKPYVGAGLGLHYLNSSIDLPEINATIPLSDYSSSRTGAHALGGVLVSFPILPFEIFAEGRYGVIFTEDESVENVSLYGGLNFKLP